MGCVQVQCPAWAQEVDCLSESLEVSASVKAKARAEYSQVSTSQRYQYAHIIWPILGCRTEASAPPWQPSLAPHTQPGWCAHLAYTVPALCGRSANS